MVKNHPGINMNLPLTTALSITKKVVASSVFDENFNMKIQSKVVLSAVFD